MPTSSGDHGRALDHGGDPDGTGDADEARLRSYAADLADGVDAGLPRWVVRSVESTMTAAGLPFDASARANATEAAEQARRQVGGEVRALLELDIDEQRSSPLAIMRRAVAYPTAVLREAGVPAVARDETDERLFPDDTYGLSPASFSDVAPALHELGLAWGAAKAFVHLERRRGEGRR